MTRVEAAILAARLIGVGSAVFLLPGLALLMRLKVSVEWPERLVLAFALSYSWILLLSIVVPIAHGTVDHAGMLTLMLLLVVRLARSGGHHVLRPRRLALPRPGNLLPAVVIVAFAASAWVIEAPITGEEALDLVSMSRFADGGPITFDNASLLPQTRAVYLFQPYQLALGLTARWSGTDPLVAFVKLRPLFVLLSLTFVYALVRRLAGSRAHAGGAFAVVLTFIALNFPRSELDALFPYLRRSGFTAGLCIPSLFVLVLAATRRWEVASFSRRMVAWTAVPLLIASLSTHPLEIFTGLCFAAATLLAAITGLDRTGDSRRAAGLVALLVAAGGAYMLLHSRAVPEVTRVEMAGKASVRSELVRMSADVGELMFGPISEEGDDLLRGDLPNTIVAVAGIAALPLAALVAPAATAVLTLAIVPLALMYASPGGVLILALLTSPDTVQSVVRYFALLGMLALSLGLVSIAQGITAAGARLRASIGQTAAVVALIPVVALTWMVLWRVEWLLTAVKADTRRAVLFAFLVAGVALGIVAWGNRRPIAVSGFSWGLLLLPPLLAAPLALGGRTIDGQNGVSLPAAFRSALARPSVLDGDAYYEVVKGTIRPPLPVPGAVIGDLRRRMPPRQVLLADPRYSCSLAVLLNAYCINPETIYGHYFLSARDYHTRYVHSIDGVPDDWHPFFNTTWPPEESERTILQEYGVHSVLADQGHAALIARKLGAMDRGASVNALREGYVLYTIK